MSQYDSNPYYGNAGGGGYLAGGSPFGSAGGSPGGQFRRGAALHSLRPVMIGQLLNATQAHSDAEWMIEDAEIGQVTVVASVITIKNQATNCVYWIDDGSGRVEARHWVDSANEEDSERWGSITEGAYIRVMGGLKMFGNKRYINAQHIRPVKDHHEFLFHTLEAMTVTRIFEKGPPPRPSDAGKDPRAVAGGSVTGPSAYTAQSNTASSTDQYAHLPPLQRRIAEFMLSRPPADEGIHVGAIARSVGGDARAISEALDKLMDDGYVFTTIDDSHFQLSV